MARTALIAVLAAFAAGLPTAAVAAQAATTGGQTRPGATTPSTESRIGGRGGFGGRSGFRRRSSRPRVNRTRPARRRQPRRGVFPGGFFGSVLKFLGFAYLLNLLFGWGPGGSPLGLLIVLGVILWLVTRRRRRRPLYY